MSVDDGSWPTRKLPVDALRAFAESVLAEVVAEVGGPAARPEASGDDPEGSWCRHAVDLSALGMPADTPVEARSRAGDTFLSWHVGSAAVAHVPKGATARETAGRLTPAALLDGLRRSVAASSRARRATGGGGFR